MYIFVTGYKKIQVPDGDPEKNCSEASWRASSQKRKGRDLFGRGPADRTDRRLSVGNGQWEWTPTESILPAVWWKKNDGAGDGWFPTCSMVRASNRRPLIIV